MFHCWSVVERWFRDYLLRPMNGNPVFNQDNKIRDDISGLTTALVVVKMSSVGSRKVPPGWAGLATPVALSRGCGLVLFLQESGGSIVSKNASVSMDGALKAWASRSAEFWGWPMLSWETPGKEGTPWWNGIRMDSLCRPSLAMCALALRLGVQGWLILLGKLRQGDGILQFLDADLQTLDLPHFFHV